MTRTLLCAFVLASAASAEPLILESEHYRLEWGGARGTGEEYSRLLEAAWPLYTEFFGKAPKLKKGEKLRVVK